MKKQILYKGKDKKEYILPLDREDDPENPAARLSEGRNMEGSFGTGRLNTVCLVSLHASSPLQDETLLEVTEAAYAVNKGGTVRNRPLLMKIGKGLFDLHKK